MGGLLAPSAASEERLLAAPAVSWAAAEGLCSAAVASEAGDTREPLSLVNAGAPAAPDSITGETGLATKCGLPSSASPAAGAWGGRMIASEPSPSDPPTDNGEMGGGGRCTRRILAYAPHFPCPPCPTLPGRWRPMAPFKAPARQGLWMFPQL